DQLRGGPGQQDVAGEGQVAGPAAGAAVTAAAQRDVAVDDQVVGQGTARSVGQEDAARQGNGAGAEGGVAGGDHREAAQGHAAGRAVEEGATRVSVVAGDHERTGPQQVEAAAAADGPREGHHAGGNGPGDLGGGRDALVVAGQAVVDGQRRDLEPGRAAHEGDDERTSPGHDGRAGAP